MRLALSNRAARPSCVGLSGSVAERPAGSRALPKRPAAARRWILFACLGASAALAGAAEPTGARRAALDRNWVVQQASEAGAWWMLVQTTCDVAAAAKLLDEMNAAMVTIGHNDLQPLVAERIEDPHLDDRSRLAMERVMQQAVAAREQADEMQQVKAVLVSGKGKAAPVQRKHWQVARPIRTAADLDQAIKDTELALGRFCAQGSERVRTALFDADKGLFGRLR